MPAPAMIGTAEVLFVVLAVIPVALLLMGGVVLGVFLLVRQATATDRRLRALEQSVAQLRER